jgi:hypothetical protein
MNKNTNSRTVETVHFVEGRVDTETVTVVWTPGRAAVADTVIADCADAHRANALNEDYTDEFGQGEVFEYELPGLRVVVLLTGGTVMTVFTVSDDAAARLHKAVRKVQPVTVTYVKADGEETVRTIEPTSLSLTKAGDVIVKAADRKSGEKRSFRLDRVRTYTTHRTAFTVRMDAPAPSKAELVQAFQARTYTVEYRNPARGERTLFETDSLDKAADAKAVAQQDAHLELIHASF